jgi:hypothetical protein
VRIKKSDVRVRQGSSLELMKMNNWLRSFNSVFELRLLRHLGLYDPAVPTHGGIARDVND